MALENVSQREELTCISVMGKSMPGASTVQASAWLLLLRAQKAGWALLSNGSAGGRSAASAWGLGSEIGTHAGVVLCKQDRTTEEGLLFNSLLLTLPGPIQPTLLRSSLLSSIEQLNIYEFS